MEAPETPVGSVGELFTWGQKTGGSKQDLLAFRSSKVRGSGARALRALLVLSHSSRDRAQVLKLTGQYDGACVLYEVRAPPRRRSRVRARDEREASRPLALSRRATRRRLATRRSRAESTARTRSCRTCRRSSSARSTC